MPYNSSHTGAEVDSAVDVVLTQLGTAALLDAGAASGVASLDSGGKVPSAQLPASVAGALNYKGVWNASTNSPSLATGTGTQGDYYKVSVAGTTTIDGVSDWNVGDFLAFNGTAWDKIDNTEEDATSTVKGRVKLTNDFAGTAALPEVAAARKSFGLKGVISITVTANQNDWAPTGLADASIIRITQSGGILPFNITGLTGGTDGRIVFIQYVGGSNGFVLVNQSASSTAGNRFALGGDMAFTAVGDSVALIYDGTASRWVAFTRPAFNSLPAVGGTVTNLTVSQRLIAQRWSNTISSLSYSATTDLDFDGVSARTLSLTGAVTFTTSNRAQGRMMKIFITCDGTPRAFTFPSWIWVQTAPTGIAASKKAVLTLECVYGSADTDIVASYAEQP